MDSRSSRVVSMSIRPKLILYPRNRLSEECRRFFRERPAFLVQLGTKRPKGAPSVCKHIPVLKRILDTRLKAFLRGTRLVPLFAQRPKFQQALLHNGTRRDRKSTRLNSSHQIISYAVFCLKKKKTLNNHIHDPSQQFING